MSIRSHQEELIQVLRDQVQVLREMRDIMASLDVDVQTATTLIGELVTALQNAGSGVSAADQTALETAIAAGQAALLTTGAAPVTPAPAETTPAAPAEAVSSSPEVA